MEEKENLGLRGPPNPARCTLYIVKFCFDGKKKGGLGSTLTGSWFPYCRDHLTMYNVLCLFPLTTE